MRPAHGILRFLRTAFLAAACTGLAWGGHNLWSQTPAPPSGFAVATAVLFPLLWYFTRVMRGLGDIFAVMAAAQVLLHLVLQASAAPALRLPGTGHTDHGLLTHALGFTPGMLLAHLWAALLASVLLAHGESALWALTALISRALPPLLRVPGLAFDPPMPMSGSTAPATPPFAVLSARGPRGPPCPPVPAPRDARTTWSAAHGRRTRVRRRPVLRARTAFEH